MCERELERRYEQRRRRVVVASFICCQRQHHRDTGPALYLLEPTQTNASLRSKASDAMGPVRDHCSFVLLAEFDIARGAELIHQHPQPLVLGSDLDGEP